MRKRGPVSKSAAVERRQAGVLRKGRVAARRRLRRNASRRSASLTWKEGGDEKEGLASLKSAGDDACLARDLNALGLFEK